MNTPGVTESLELSQKYGIINWLVIIIILAFLAAFFLTLRWVFKTTNEREKTNSTIINVGMAGITAALQSNTVICQQLAQNLKDGFDILKRADEYHRSDLSAISKKIDENECRA